MARISDLLDGDSRDAVLALGSRSGPAGEGGDAPHDDASSPGRVPMSGKWERRRVSSHRSSGRRKDGGHQGHQGRRAAQRGRQRGKGDAAAVSRSEDLVQEIRALSNDLSRAKKALRSMPSKKMHIARKLATGFESRAAVILRAAAMAGDPAIRDRALVLTQQVAGYASAVSLDLPSTVAERRTRPRFGALAPARPLPRSSPGPRHTDYYDDPTLSK